MILDSIKDTENCVSAVRGVPAIFVSQYLLLKKSTPQKRYRNSKNKKNPFWPKGFGDIEYHLQGETKKPKGG